MLDFDFQLPENFKKQAQNYINQSNEMLKKLAAVSNLKKGDKVHHNILGDGIIMEVDDKKHIYTVLFTGMLTPRQMSFKSPLTKIE